MGCFLWLLRPDIAIQAEPVKVFNEAYYQLTRIVFERPDPVQMESYVQEIRADLGWSDSAPLVIAIACSLYTLCARPMHQLYGYLWWHIEELFGGSQYWQAFQKKVEQLQKRRWKVSSSFRPVPMAPGYFDYRYVDWSDITFRYQPSCIGAVLDLWSGVDDKKAIAERILKSMEDSGLYYPKGMECDQVREFLNRNFVILGESQWQTGEPQAKRISVAELEKTELERQSLQKRIAELERRLYA